jgi:HEAT repeat protein
MSASCASSMIACCLVLIGLQARAEEISNVAESFKAARPKITQELRDRDSAVRVAAVHKLAEFPLVESAKLLVPVLAGNDGPLSRASFEGLVKMTGDSAVRELLEHLAAKHWKQPKPHAEAFGVIAVLLASESPDVQQGAAELVAAAADRSVPGRTMAIDLVDQLGTGGGEASCRALVQLSALPRCESDFAFRRAIVQSLIGLRVKPAVTALVEMLAKISGEVRADIVKFLSEISGQDLNLDAEHWIAWWRDNEATFAFPKPAEPELPRFFFVPAVPAANSPSYYGLPLTAAKIVFVIDASGSMQGARIAAAKRELAKAVESLPDSVTFNIVPFHTRPLAWRPKLVPATEENKRNALYYIAALTLGDKTASYDALEAALRFDAEAIYFLTDGAPTAGKITSPPQIVAAISQQNRYRRLTINSIGIGVSAGAFEVFLSTLAQQNYGRFERVDQ